MIDELHRFWCHVVLIAARCKRCGALVSVYTGHDPNCTECTASDDEGWHGVRVDRRRRCKCDPPPALPDRPDPSALASRRRGPSSHDPDRAPYTIYI